MNMDYQTKEKLELAEHAVPPAPGSSEASAKNPEEERTYCFSCSYQTGSITVAISYLLVSLSVLGLVIRFLCIEDAKDITVIFFVLLSSTIISVVLIPLMLYGAVKRRPQYLLPWAVWEGMSIGLGSAFVVISLFFISPVGLVGFIFIALRGFCLYVVLQYRKQLTAQPPKSEVNSQA
ncbi:uncharacterized protein LOC125027044 isoform X3 [Penaeus chinensis]|nr:uncharacterized protein LOC125027044 isoform X2 [Penaeus chinensis]XP_047471645.1 uncharacterized protein LOC125027044 isoform X3 [Penaeus chinensis]